MKKKLLIYILSIPLFFTLSCKKAEVIPGPQGTQGKDFDPNGFYGTREGFIKDTITGTRLDGVTYKYPFYFDGSESSENTYHVISPTKTKIIISKYYSGTGDKSERGHLRLEIFVRSLNDLSSSELSFIEFSLIRDLGNNTFFKTYKQTGNAATWNSNMTYNPTTGILNGQFSVNIDADLDTGTLSITNGSFSTRISKAFAREGVE